MTRLTILQQSLLLGALTILLVAQAPLRGYAEGLSTQSDQTLIPEHILACQKLVRLLSSITLTTRENFETTSRARRVDRHNSTVRIPHSTLRP